MAWTTPRTWVPAELVTAALLNAHVRDNLNLVKTQMDDEGALKTLLAGFAFSTGDGNDAGSGDTQLSLYDVTIDADFLGQPGDALVIDGTFSISANSGTKTAKMQVASGTLITILSTTGTTNIVPFRYVLRRRGSTTGSLTGIAWEGAASGGTPTPYMVNSALGSVDWTSSQTLKIFGAATNADDILLTDYTVNQARGVTGTTV